jgi:asparagine synthase (glutamine-hydrolysing)
MCGICGVVSSADPAILSHEILRKMCQPLYHRGPDDEGYYLDSNAGLGMRRLSIIDLTSGDQPICNEDGTLWLVFNGEIYNFRQLRTQLEGKGHVFKTNSDSEVIIHAFEEFGYECLNQFNGMFAFAVWDVNRRSLFLARDRIGIKPLYYWAYNHGLVFGSELSALLAHPNVPRNVDYIAVDQFLTLEYIPSPRSILQGVNKLLPGHYLLFHEDQLTLKQYWDVPIYESGLTAEDSIEELRYLLKDSVRLQLVSDVPLGAFLSGGIDSSTVVAHMSDEVSDPIKTFTIGFRDDSYDETQFARMVSTRFGTEHHEEILRPDISDLADKLIGHLDEPLADFSIFPTYLVSKIASRFVKVVLSGDGGDEVFAGYDSYVAQIYDSVYSRVPARIRRGIIPNLVSFIPPQATKKGAINKAKRFIEGSALPATLQHSRWMIFLNPEQRDALYQPWFKRSLNGSFPYAELEKHFEKVAHAEPLAQQQYVDIKSYLVDNILTKVDRMSMAASIETRVPLLDHRIVELALNLTGDQKIRGQKTKIILRQAMRGYLPTEVLDKPKQGFSIPLKHWLNGPLRPMMADLLSEQSIQRRGYFDSRIIADWIEEHNKGRVNHSHRLWSLMVLELWQRKTLDTI